MSGSGVSFSQLASFLVQSGFRCEFKTVDDHLKMTVHYDDDEHPLSYDIVLLGPSPITDPDQPSYVVTFLSNHGVPNWPRPETLEILNQWILHNVFCTPFCTPVNEVCLKHSFGILDFDPEHLTPLFQAWHHHLLDLTNTLHKEELLHARARR